MVKEKVKNSSVVLGTLGIILGILLSPLVGVVLGIIGLSIKKNPENYNKAITLNVLAIVLSVVTWFITIILLFSLIGI